jgi:putative transposon-encoded protein
MRKVKVESTAEVTVKKILGFIEKRVTPFGTGAKVDCPKEYIGKKVYLIICKN